MEARKSTPQIPQEKPPKISQENPIFGQIRTPPSSRCQTSQKRQANTTPQLLRPADRSKKKKDRPAYLLSITAARDAANHLSTAATESARRSPTSPWRRAETETRKRSRGKRRDCGEPSGRRQR
uniref:Uncharacterized protein n=1 Tax=Arundo donax TaxID=35708 RepID=A0A0A9DGP9_ARUDO